MSFKGKTVAVTGAANGIGRACALSFAAEGARLALFDREADALEMTAQDCRKAGSDVFAFTGDMTDSTTVADAFAKAEKALGPIDVLVNNIGQTARENMTPFADAAIETLDFVVDVSLRSALYASRQVAPFMRARKAGRIISISSDSAFNGDLGCVDYAAAKAGLLGFTRALARELAPFSVTVNAVCPGPTNTRAMQRIPKDSFERAKNAVPMGVICEAEDIANAVLFFASDKARFITGQTLLVNGGRVFH